MFSACWLDEEKCDRLVSDPQNYRKGWDEKLGQIQITAPAS